VRDSLTGKTLGYGFVPLKKSKDFLAYLSEMEAYSIHSAQEEQSEGPHLDIK
jgi:hypothetical protein